VRELDPARKIAVLSDGSDLPYDLFLGVPVHRAPAVVEQSGMTVDGWIPVDSLTLETGYPGVYAVGDVTSVGTPKAGVYAEGQAAVVATRISALIRGTTDAPQYDGRGMCYLEFGGDQVARVAVTFLSGQKPFASQLEGPSPALAADKLEFGSSRIQRWFGRIWSADQ
jgi:sulfide:quinone oxidoreductase